MPFHPSIGIPAYSKRAHCPDLMVADGIQCFTSLTRDEAFWGISRYRRQICKAPLWVSARISPRVFLGLGARGKAVAGGGLGENELWVGRIRLDLFSQLVDAYPEVLHLVAIVRPPDGL